MGAPKTAVTGMCQLQCLITPLQVAHAAVVAMTIASTIDLNLGQVAGPSTLLSRSD